MAEGYVTLKKEGQGELVDRRSRFVALCAPVMSEPEALAFIDCVRAQHKTASHVVWAYNLRQQNLCRYTDDGEPSGTAGLPVLDVLRRGDILDAAIAVVRYFGGTLLGTGGLVRAYGGAASLAVDDAGRAFMTLCADLSIRCGYGDYDRMTRLLADCGAEVLDTAYTDEVEITCRILQEKRDALRDAVRELTRGASEPAVVSEGFFPVELPGE